MSISTKTIAMQDACPAKCEVRGVIRFLRLQGQPASRIHEQLISVYGSGVISIEKVREGCRKVDAGCTEIHDLPQCGRPNTAMNDSITAIHGLIQENCRIAEEEIRHSLIDKNYRGIAWNGSLYCSQTFRVLKGKHSMGP